MGKIGRTALRIFFPFVEDSPGMTEAEEAEAHERVADAYATWEDSQRDEALAAYRAELQTLPRFRRRNPKYYRPLMEKHGIEPPPDVTVPFPR